MSGHFGTFPSIVVYNCLVPRHKPVPDVGQDLRDIPTYTIPEAAAFLAVPARTMQSWFSRKNHLLRPASECAGKPALLSFRDLTEAYILQVLRSFYRLPMQSMRHVLENAKAETGLEHPLLDADLRVLFRRLVLKKPARGRRKREFLDLSHGRQLAMPEVVDVLGQRVLTDSRRGPYRIYPWRFLLKDDSRPVSLDPDVLSGRLVITGTRIPVRVVLGRKLAGESARQIAADYDIDPDAVQRALEHIEGAPQAA
jgi:uncharacterized protein (DUF433 family)